MAQRLEYKSVRNMVRLNHHYQKLSTSYLFSEIEKRLEAFQVKKPSSPLINLGIGDFTQALPQVAVEGLIKAAQELGEAKTFRGYGPSEGYLFLREAIAQSIYSDLDIQADEIFISDGANSDLSNLQEIFSTENKIALQDPTYPVYLDTNVMAGRTRLPLKTGRYGGVVYLPCTEETKFQALPPFVHADLIYLCSPNNPTGVGLTRDTLTRWVAYALEHQAILLFDGAYEAYITSDIPHSIYEIPGAKEVAIEVRSFSKNAGFTGLRCSYTTIPHALRIKDAGTIHSLHSLWKRRVHTKSNGVAYPVQRAAEALFTPQGIAQIQQSILLYQNNAKTLLQGLQDLGYKAAGGIDAPYVWCQVPAPYDSWKFFQLLLEQLQIIALPGRGFGICGEGYIRFSAFAPSPSLKEGLARLKTL